MLSSLYIYIDKARRTLKKSWTASERRSKNCTARARFFLHKEQFGRSYQYDANGNVLSTKNLAALQSYATYDAFNNMLSYRQPGRPSGDKFTMTHGSTDAEKKTHLVKTSKSPLDMHQEYTYDNKGNVLTQKTRNSTGATFIKGETAYTTDRNYATEQTDARGKTVSVTDPDGQTVSYAYDAPRRVTGVQTTADETARRLCAIPTTCGVSRLILPAPAPPRSASGR